MASSGSCAPAAPGASCPRAMARGRPSRPASTAGNGPASGSASWLHYSDRLMRRVGWIGPCTSWTAPSSGPTSTQQELKGEPSGRGTWSESRRLQHEDPSAVRAGRQAHGVHPNGGRAPRAAGPTHFDGTRSRQAAGPATASWRSLPREAVGVASPEQERHVAARKELHLGTAGSASSIPAQLVSLPIIHASDGSGRARGLKR
jgi:hypothetical protein